jgi:hypothetical protein
MAFGLEMLLKQFGLDPEDMKRQAGEWAQKAQQTVGYFVARFDGTDKRLARMEAKLDALLSERGIVMIEGDAMRVVSNGADHVKPN